MRNIRNIGLIAHINAGKTTTTERVIYYSGLSQTLGDVDRGNTVTDYLKQERDRGITITSAAVSFKWRRHKINLIDTPGHVDFTIEVERSLSVMDGVVTLLDASAGVEAQTMTVWNQADKYKLPNLIYLNKYDKQQASLEMCLKEIKSKLGVQSALIHLPCGQYDKFSGVYNILDRTKIFWDKKKSEIDYGASFFTVPITAGDKMLDVVEGEREKLINHLSDVDDEFVSQVIERDKIKDVPASEIYMALRRCTANRTIFPVLIGSSFKNIGVQLLMDAIVDYLPSPPERAQTVAQNLKDVPELTIPSLTGSLKDLPFCAFIFKIIHDRNLGILSFVRIYAGTLHWNQKLLNLFNGSHETTKRVYEAFADEFKEVKGSVGKGDIAVITGLRNSKTGDILIDPDNLIETTRVTQPNQGPMTLSDNSAPSLQVINGLVVPKIKFLEPVFYCSIEAPSMSKQRQLEDALLHMSREDPTFTYKLEDDGQIIIKGMGKLHLEVIRDRIETEYNVDADLGTLQISYKETIQGSAQDVLYVNKVINDTKNNIVVGLKVDHNPKAGNWSSKRLKVSSLADSDLAKLRKDHRKALEHGILSVMSHGPVKGFPIVDCDVELVEFVANNRASLPMISSAASQCLVKVMRQMSPILLEPIMSVEVSIPLEFNGIIMSNLTVRRGIIVQSTPKVKSIILRAYVPLSEMSDYSEFLRITTSGQGTFSMQLLRYEPVGTVDQK